MKNWRVGWEGTGAWNAAHEKRPNPMKRLLSDVKEMFLRLQKFMSE